MRKSPRIAVIGGGPAGLTAAVILHKRGYAVTVYEADSSSDFRDQGGSLDLHEDKGQVALRYAGLLDTFRQIARHEDQHSKNVDPVSGLVQPNTRYPGDELDRPEIDRGVLRDLLLAPLPKESLVWGARLQDLEFGSSGAHHLHFINGKM